MAFDEVYEAADTFDAEGEFLSARKKLLDSSHPAMKAVTRTQIAAAQESLVFVRKRVRTMGMHPSASGLSS